MIRLASETPPVELAWAAYDRAAIRLHEMYARAARTPDTAERRAQRMAASEEAARLWGEWRALFLAPSDPEDAA